jgi:aminoglycoside phosphotransferase (APT) family kinase protein
MPAAEFDVDESLVRALLRDQHPDIAHLELSPAAFGWDNVIFRLGDALTVRLPRRAEPAERIVYEQRWLPQLERNLPLPIPTPLRRGRPGRGYPCAWSVTPWFAGDTACDTPPTDPMLAADTLGGFLSALHQPAPTDAPENPWRGVPLAERATRVDECLTQLEGIVATASLRTLWEELVATPAWSGPPLWLHGDLHPANVLVHEGRLAAVIDFGDLTSGDPATDLSVAWMLFSPEGRLRFRDSVGAVDDATWSRARGWALALGLVYVAGAADHPTITRIGHDVLAAVLADDS